MESRKLHGLAGKGICQSIYPPSFRGSDPRPEQVGMNQQKLHSVIYKELQCFKDNQTGEIHQFAIHVLMVINESDCMTRFNFDEGIIH